LAWPDEEDIPVSYEDDAQSEHVGYGRQLVVVGGGRGGVGKTLVSQNLAVYFAQLGKTVTLVDADATGSNMHSQLGAVAARKALSPDEATGIDEAIVATSVPGLDLLRYPHDALRPPSALRGGRKARWLSRLRNLDADYIVVDIGPGHSDFQIDTILAADVPILVTSPEPPAVEATYRFLRAAFLRRLRRALSRDRLRLTLLDRALSEHGYLAPPMDVIRSLRKLDQKLAELAWSECCKLRVHLVANQTRARTDTELGAWMSELCDRHYGVRVIELGHIEYDDTAWLAVRRCKPLLVDSPTSKSARNLERIARRVLAVLVSGEHAPEETPPMAENVPNHYAILGVTRGSSDEDIRRAYKRKREVYASGSLATSSLFTPEGLRAEQSRLDEGYDTLLDPIRRRAYDLSTFPEEEAKPALEQTPRPVLVAEQLMLQTELLREIGPDTEFSGELLRKVRESQGVDVAEISAKTKISRTYLKAIEEENPAELPAAVYVRGFVSELAKFLRLDATQVQTTYMRRLREMPRMRSSPPSADTRSRR